MGLLFSSDFHDGIGRAALGYVPYGGADVGEVERVARDVGDGDDSAYYEAWMAAGDRLISRAADARSAGHVKSASDLFLRASVFYNSSFSPLLGEPVDPRLVKAFDLAMEMFHTGLTLTPSNIEQFAIPFENARMPAYFIPASARPDGRGPVVIFTNGYDANLIDMFFGSAVAASRRGYHSVIFDGPGQGDVLIHQGVRIRPDWETVITAVVDVVAKHPLVNPDQIVLNGWSLGGYLALRAATGEHRLAACIADPGQWAITDSLGHALTQAGGSPDSLGDLGSLDDHVLARLSEVFAQNRKTRWSIFQRGFWVHGVTTLRDYLASAQKYTIAGRAQDITCPTLITVADNDPLAAYSATITDALTCPNTVIRFTDDDGAAQHCELLNRSLLNARTFDWLDKTLNPALYPS